MPPDSLQPDNPGQERERERTRARRLEKLRFWRSACAEGMPVAARYNAASDAPPLFFFHGDWDNGGFYMARLAAGLPCPVIALAPHLGPVPPTIRAMAQDRLPAILGERADGPYRLGGFCNGALVAYEAARLLIEQGRAVESVLLVAPPCLNARRSYRGILALAERWLAAGPDSAPARRRRHVRLMGRVTKLWRLSGYSLAAIGTVLARKRRLRAAARARLDPHRVREPADLAAEAAIHHRRRALLSAYEAAVHAYGPAPIPSRLVVFGTGLDAAGRPAPGYDAAYDGRAWAELCPQAVCIPVPGDHYTCIADHVPDLALAMCQALRAGRDTEVDAATGTAPRGVWFGPVLAPAPDEARLPG